MPNDLCDGSFHIEPRGQTEALQTGHIAACKVIEFAISNFERQAEWIFIVVLCGDRAWQEVDVSLLVSRPNPTVGFDVSYLECPKFCRRVFLNNLRFASCLQLCPFNGIVLHTRL